MNRRGKRLLFSGRGSETIRFVLFSDLHMIAEAADDPTYPSLSSPPMIYYTARKKLQILVNSVNNLMPDAVIFLGDAINYQDYENSFDMFMDYWSSIDSDIKKSISAGNHDYAYNADYDAETHGMSLENYTAYKLGYGDRTPVAGSKFNESFSVSGSSLSVRFINFDTNFTSNGEHSSTGTGYIPSDEISWMQSELMACNDNVAFIYSHKGASKSATSYLNDADRIALENMLGTVSQAKPGLKIYYLYGHSHIASIAHGYTPNGKFETYNCSALVDNLSSPYYMISVDRKGIRAIEALTASY